MRPRTIRTYYRGVSLRVTVRRDGRLHSVTTDHGDGVLDLLTEVSRDELRGYVLKEIAEADGEPFVLSEAQS